MIVHVTRTIDVGRRVRALDGPSPADDPTDRIIADYRATIVAMKCAMSERLVRLGISMAQLNILYTLQRTGEMPMSRLADVLNVSLSNATGLVDRMEERGFVERTRVPEDRRVVLVRITDAGEPRARGERRADRRPAARGPRPARPDPAARSSPPAMAEFRASLEATVDVR